MTRASELISASGIDPRQGAAEVAALMARRFPMRIGAEPSGSPEESVERGWCAGPEEFADLMERVTGAQRQEGTAFGSVWPWLEVAGQVVSPGLPVRISQGVEDLGPDGAYTREGPEIFREAAGRRKVLIRTGAGKERNLPEFTLLWFSETARFLVRDNQIEIGDLFSRTTSWVDRGRLENLLVRANRVDANVVEGLTFEKHALVTMVEVARRHETTRAPWRDPRVFLQNRIDVDSVASQGDRIVIQDVRGETVEFQIVQSDSGWLIERGGGQFPFEGFRIQKEGELLVLRATLSPDIDVFLPGIRGRVVFDLNADLAAFMQHQKV